MAHRSMPEIEKRHGVHEQEKALEDFALARWIQDGREEEALNPEAARELYLSYGGLPEVQPLVAQIGCTPNKGRCRPAHGSRRGS